MKKKVSIVKLIDEKPKMYAVLLGSLPLEGVKELKMDDILNSNFSLHMKSEIIGNLFLSKPEYIRLNLLIGNVIATVFEKSYPEETGPRELMELGREYLRKKITFDELEEKKAEMARDMMYTMSPLGRNSFSKFVMAANQTAEEAVGSEFESLFNEITDILICFCRRS